MIGKSEVLEAEDRIAPHCMGLFSHTCKGVNQGKEPQNLLFSRFGDHGSAVALRRLSGREKQALQLGNRHNF